MFEELAKVVKVIDLAGEIRGRVKLQKMIYILQHLGYPFFEDYEYLHYGPYSYELTDELRSLKQFNVIDEEGLELSDDVIAYRYKITGESKKFVDELVPDELQDDPFKELVEKLNNQDSRVLEVASVLFYLTERGYSLDEATEEMENLKPDRVEFIAASKKLLGNISKYQLS